MCVVQMWSKLLSPMLQLRMGSSDQAELAKILRCRIRAISSAVVTLQPCLQKICGGLKAKLQPGPLCTSLQCLLQGVPAVPQPVPLCTEEGPEISGHAVICKLLEVACWFVVKQCSA
jgi:hypothetical protein